MTYWHGAAWLGPVALTGILGLTLGFSSLTARAQVASPVAFEINNYTFSAGDATFNVTDDLPFKNLTLMEQFVNGADTRKATLTLFDPANTPATTLDVFSYLDSGTALSPSIPAGYTLFSAILTGSIDTSNPTTFIVNKDGTLTVNTQTDAFDPTTAGTATIGPNFTANLTPPVTGQPVTFYAQNPDGTVSNNALGTVSVSTVPEPATLAPFAVGALGLMFLVTCKRRQNRLSQN